MALGATSIERHFTILDKDETKEYEEWFLKYDGNKKTRKFKGNQKTKDTFKTPMKYDKYTKSNRNKYDKYHKYKKSNRNKYHKSKTLKKKGFFW